MNENGLDCPKCGTPTKSAAGLAAHMRSHDTRTVPCPVPGCTATPRAAGGLGRHMTEAHGINAKDRRSEAKKDEEFRRLRLQATLERLVPSLAETYLVRLFAFSLKHAPARDTYAVIGPEFGPVMVNRVMVGGVVARAGTACIVIDLGTLRDAQEAAAIAARTGS